MRNLPTTFDAMSCVQDELCGVRVPAHFYHDVDESIFEGFTHPDDEFEGFFVPFAVLLLDSGLDYDAEGNSYFDDYPSWFAVSYHRIRKGAEIAAAYHMDDCPTQAVDIAEHFWVDDYQARGCFVNLV